MKKTALYMLICLLSVLALSAEAMEVRRFGLFIGANDGGEERQRLLYADDDAQTIMLTMEQIGGIDPSDSLLLLDPSAGKILEALTILSQQISDVDRLVRRTEIMFYYSGHSNEEGLLLSDEDLPYKDIREALDDSGADVVIAVLDSCSSGAFTRAKGGQRRSPFLVDESSDMEGHAFLTSSSESELSQESDRIKGSFFTHNLVTGLRGAADNTGDSRVSLNEVYEHTFRETLSSTESTIGGPQHATYEIQLTGRGDLVLTDLTIPTSALMISGELSGQFSIRAEQENKLIAEFTKHEEETFKLALPAGEYKVNMTSGDNVSSAEVELTRNGQFFLTEEDFSSRQLAWTRFRGDGDQGDELKVHLTFSLVPGLDYPALSSSSVVNLQVGFFSYTPRLDGWQASIFSNISGSGSEGIQVASFYNMANADFKGFQGSAFFNQTTENMDGVQFSGLLNLAGGSLDGIQGAGLFNIAGDEMEGVQLAGLFNIAGRPSSGVQAAGIFNIAGEIEGVQIASTFNSTEYLDGFQLGVVNRAKTMNGVQLGIVNVSREMDGVAIGLINLSRNGIVDTGAWYERGEENHFYTFFQSGNRYFYTLYYVGNSGEEFLTSTDDLTWGMHVGSRLTLGPLELDLDGGVKTSYPDQVDQIENDSVIFVPSARAVVALKGLGFFGGFSMVMSYPGAGDSTLYEGKGINLMGIEDLTIYPHMILGYRF
ncbi:MAG: caspase family protein [Spirochaetales bacterium]|nr:caspase family protein [Spirochaetales bacterium]